MFKKETVSKLGFYHHSSKKAWMTKKLVWNWLKSLKAFLKKETGSRVLPLVDNRNDIQSEEGEYMFSRTTQQLHAVAVIEKTTEHAG